MSRRKIRSQEFTCPICGEKFSKVTEVKEIWSDEEIHAMCPKCNPVKLFTQDWPRDENGRVIITNGETASLGTFGLQTAKSNDNYKRVNEKLASITSSTPNAQKFEPKF